MTEENRTERDALTSATQRIGALEDEVANVTGLLTDLWHNCEDWKQAFDAFSDPLPPEAPFHHGETYPVLSASGFINQVAETRKDVTTVERLRQATSQTAPRREFEQRTSELLGTVSHELRSPLTVIHGYATTLLTHDTRLSRAERREFLGYIRDASDRLSVLIERMIEFSRLESGILQFHFMSVDAERLVHVAVAAAIARDSTHPHPHHTYAIQTTGDTLSDPRSIPLVYADPDRLGDVLGHLLDNACKYSPRGGQIDIVLQRATGMSTHVAPERAPEGETEGETEGAMGTTTAGTTRRSADATHEDATLLRERMLEICVRDTGIGIPPEHLHRIFERFHRVDASMTREFDGLGLGLALCKRIIALHGGQIWAESTPGVGSAFHVLLPLSGTSAA